MKRTLALLNNTLLSNIGDARRFNQMLKEAERLDFEEMDREREIAAMRRTECRLQIYRTMTVIDEPLSRGDLRMLASDGFDFAPGEFNETLNRMHENGEVLKRMTSKATAEFSLV